MKYLFSLLPTLLFAVTLSSCASSQSEVNRSLSTQPFNVPAEWERQGGGSALGSALGSNNYE